ncbi:hypothetical protein [Dokdonella sp.]|uniref:energy transducer TonB n=1 Tax=Dokdonella sp. TaxID=2291710 RepID=UPI001B0E4B4F|nr:hypothetical protein [Dokdonella sp.]MBO9663653.1 hypothetical protein [Dokdonella sp.]
MKRLVVALAALSMFSVVKAEKGADKPIRTGGEWAVSLDAQGHVLALKQTSELKPVLAEPLERAIRGWAFEPGKLSGQPQPTETSLSLSIVMEPIGGDGYAIRIEDAQTGGRPQKMVSPRLPSRDVREGSYLYVMRVAYAADGKVVSIAPEAGTPEVPSGVRKNFEAAVKEWTFEPERIGGKPLAAEVVVPLCVSMWRNSFRQPAGMEDGCAWKSPQKHSPVESGQFVAVDPAARLLTDVVGRTL